MCQTVLKHVLVMKAKRSTLDETIRDRTVQPLVDRDESSHEQTMLNEVNIDFRIPELHHSVVKQVESSRALVQKDREPPRSTCS